MNLTWRTKTIIWAVAVLLLIGVAVFLTCRCDRAGVLESAIQYKIPPGWQAANVLKTPLLGKNKASEYTAEFPPGSRVVVVETPKGETVEIGILPGGQVVTREGVTATVYEKREAFVEAQVRPFIGAGAIGPELGVAAAIGVDVVRVWKVNLGLGALINDEAVAGAGFVSYPVWRNVDARVGGGYGTAGGVGFAGVSIGIE